MSNLLDYLDWRGDLSFDASPFCDVDSLIICRLSYIPYDGVVSDSFSESINLGEAAEKVLSLLAESGDGRTVRDEHDPDLLKKIIESPRFNNIRLTGYVNTVSPENQKQFSAVTMIFPDGNLYVAFRGTDGTLVGWKEDFNMSFIDIVPAQSDAVKYIEQAAEALNGTIRVGGHSKGGNLAVYASAFCMGKVRERITDIRNFDGPGFNENTIGSDEFLSILPRVKTFLPQSSIVGMLLEHAEKFTVVFSTGSGILQHDMYTWDVTKDGFMCVDQLSDKSHFIDATLKDWLAGMTIEQREKMIDGLYSIMVDSNITTTQNLFSRKNITSFFKTFENTDEETKKNISQAMKILRKSFKNSLIVTLSNVQKKDAPKKAET